jgi:CRP-like cAMP-binding protein
MRAAHRFGASSIYYSAIGASAGALLLLARYGIAGPPRRLRVKVSQEVLAEMVGTTRPRVNYFMNKFRKLGFIEYNGGIQINEALLSVVLHE